MRRITARSSKSTLIENPSTLKLSSVSSPSAMTLIKIPFLCRITNVDSNLLSPISENVSFATFAKFISVSINSFLSSSDHFTTPSS